MLFNSTAFLFVFLPVTLAGFYLLGSISRSSAIRWLILASLVFYACWRPVNVLIITPSIIINYIIARVLLWLNENKGSPRLNHILRRFCCRGLVNPPRGTRTAYWCNAVLRGRCRSYARGAYSGPDSALRGSRPPERYP